MKGREEFVMPDRGLVELSTGSVEELSQSELQWGEVRLTSTEGPISSLVLFCSKNSESDWEEFAWSLTVVSAVETDDLVGSEAVNEVSVVEVSVVGSIASV